MVLVKEQEHKDQNRMASPEIDPNKCSQLISEIQAAVQ